VSYQQTNKEIKMNAAFLEMIEAIGNVKVHETPNYKAAMAFATSPNVKFPNPAEVAFGMEIEVNEDFVNDPDFGKVVDAYVDCLNRIHAQLRKDFPAEVADRIFAKMATKFSLKYTY